MIHWRIYYDDGSTFSNEDGEWRDAPKNGVICIPVRDPTNVWGRWVIQSGWHPPSGSAGGNDYYVKRPDCNEPYATDKEGLALFLDLPGTSMEDVKYGRMVPQQMWQDIMARASADPDFPRNSPKRRATDKGIPGT